MKQFSKFSAICILIAGLATPLLAQQTGNGQQMRQQQFAQQNERPYMMIPDLTDAQKDQIKDIKYNTMKQVQALKSQLMEKRAHLRTLTIAEKADLKAINSQIDEIAKLEASIQKQRAASHQGVRNILTDEQRVVFDARAGHRMGGNGFGPGQGCGQGRGRGQGRGAGFGNGNFGNCPFNN